MKNIHVLPTDKASRLHTYKGVLNLAANEFVAPTIVKNDLINLNIYITSDEEIKEGDWFYTSQYNTIDKLYSNGVINANYCKKIILTTDQDLIADGVQAIDDEFLEWFVKNPSCEWVEVEKENICARCHSNDVDECWSAKDCSDGRYDKIRYKIIIPQGEPKQETLEEIRNQEISEDYYPPKDLANAIWGSCFQYEDIENNNIREKVKNACFMIEKIYKIQELCKK